MSRLASTLVAAAVIITAAVIVHAPTHTARTAAAADILATQQPTTPWSAPTRLTVCPANPNPRVLFPSNNPSHATGPGAIVWSASPACPGGEGPRVAAIGAGDLPGTPTVPHDDAGHALATRGSLTAAPGPHGRIVIAATTPASTKATGKRPPSIGLLIQGPATGPFVALTAPGGTTAPIALTTAYLGDLALASQPANPRSIGALNVHVERFFAHNFAHNVSVRSAGNGAVQALTLAMDFRGEALPVWAQHGALYARLVPNKGAPRPLQRIAPVGSYPHIAALLSDDNRAIVAWSEQRGTQTSVYIDRSAAGVRFSPPQLLERFQDPAGLSAPAASPSLVRMSSESVILAWAGASAGHWVIRTAPVDLNGVQTVGTFAAPGGDALLAGLAAGPNDDALLLWTEPLPTAGGAPDLAQQALFAARGTDAGPGRTSFDEPEPVAPAGPVSNATVAFDPASDRAVAAWQGEAATIQYAIRNPGTSPSRDLGASP